MANIVASKLFPSKIGKVGFIYPVFFAIIISMFLVQLILLVSPYQENTMSSLQSSFSISTLVNLVFVSVFSAFGLYALFKIKKIGNHLASNILIAIFIEGGMLAIMLFGKLFFITVGFESPIFLVFVAIVAYVGSYFVFLSFVGRLSRKAKNRLFIISSGSLGSFLGLLLPFPIIIVVSVVLAVADTILIQKSLFKGFLGEANYEKMIIEMAFSTSEWGIGIGDLISYSMIVAGTFVNFGLVVGCLSLLCILLATIFTMRLTAKQKYVPGLPIATVFGLLPSIVFFVL